MKTIELHIQTSDKDFAIKALEKVIEKIKADGLEKAFWSDAKNNGNYFFTIT